MPKAMIYKISVPNLKSVYIGSTTEKTLGTRLSKHKCDYNNWLKGKQTSYRSFPLVKNKNVKIDLVESFNYQTKKDIENKEAKYIKNCKNCLNKIIPNQK